MGIRVLKVITNKGDLNGTTRFIWGGEGDWQCLEERASGGDLVARYTYDDALCVRAETVNDTFHGLPDPHRGPPQGIRCVCLS